jgi:hypothetical protein
MTYWTYFSGDHVIKPKDKSKEMVFLPVCKERGDVPWSTGYHCWKRDRSYDPFEMEIECDNCRIS